MQRLALQPGTKFGRLTVIGFHSISKWGHTKWDCVCECGNETVVHGRYLNSGHTKSCGCAARDATSKANTTHGKTGCDEYRSWLNMKNRCYNASVPEYERYGGRGIIVCDRWRNSFENFLADMGRKPAKGRDWSIDRINNDSDYEPSNCRWASRKQQANNRRKRRWKKRPTTA